MMEAFAQRYCLCNPGVFQSTGWGPASWRLGKRGWAGGGAGGTSACVITTRLSTADTCYVLSFAVIMLNTSLHNPNVRDKPGLERFVAMNRGINEGGDLPEDLLRVRPPPPPLPPPFFAVPLPAPPPFMSHPAGCQPVFSSLPGSLTLCLSGPLCCLSLACLGSLSLENFVGLCSAASFLLLHLPLLPGLPCIHLTPFYPEPLRPVVPVSSLAVGAPRGWAGGRGPELLTPPFAPQNLYDSIRNEPFKIPEDDGNDLTHTFFNPDREGWLLKLGTSPTDPAWLALQVER